MKPLFSPSLGHDVHLTQIEHDWLTNNSSLTRRLREFTHGKISHHLFFNDWEQPDSVACTALKINADAKAWVRRMEWRYENEVWVTCTVVIPETSIYPNNTELLSIGKNSIGDILFQDPTLKRTDFIFSQHDDQTWLRESFFYYKQKPIYLTELFLPDFFKAIRCA